MWTVFFIFQGSFLTLLTKKHDIKFNKWSVDAQILTTQCSFQSYWPICHDVKMETWNSFAIAAIWQLKLGTVHEFVEYAPKSDIFCLLFYFLTQPLLHPTYPEEPTLMIWRTRANVPLWFVLRIVKPTQTLVGTNTQSHALYNTETLYLFTFHCTVFCVSGLE